MRCRVVPFRGRGPHSGFTPNERGPARPFKQTPETARTCSATSGLGQAPPCLGLVFLDVVERLLDRLRLADVVASGRRLRLGTVRALTEQPSNQRADLHSSSVNP